MVLFILSMVYQRKLAPSRYANSVVYDGSDLRNVAFVADVDPKARKFSARKLSSCSSPIPEGIAMRSIFDSPQKYTVAFAPPSLCTS